MNKKYRWFIANTITNYEKKVASDLEKKKASMNIEEITDIKVPMKTYASKNGTLKEAPRFPGYVYIRIAVNERNQPSEDIWKIIRNLTGCKGLLKNDDFIMSLSDEEIKSKNL